MGGRQSPGAVSIVFRGHARGQLAPCTSTTGRPTEAAWPSVGATLADRWPSRCHGADLAVGRRTSYRRGQSTSGPRVLGPGRTRGTGRASARPVLRAHHRVSRSDWGRVLGREVSVRENEHRSALGRDARTGRPQAGWFFALEQRPPRAARYQRRSRPSNGIAAIFSSVRSSQRSRGNVQLFGHGHRRTRSGVTMTSTWSRARSWARAARQHLALVHRRDDDGVGVDQARFRRDRELEVAEAAAFAEPSARPRRRRHSPVTTRSTGSSSSTLTVRALRAAPLIELAVARIVGAGASGSSRKKGSCSASRGTAM